MKEFIKKYWKETIIVVLGFACVILLMSTTCTNQKNKVLRTNIVALTDTVKSYQLKTGELMYEKQGFILEKQELEKYLSISKKEVKDLEKQLGSALATIAQLQGQVKIDTLIMSDSIKVSNDTVYIFFDYEDQWLTLDGTTIYKNPWSRTTLNCLTMNVPLKIGTSKDDKWFVTTDNPYVSFTSIEGANLDKSKPKRFAIAIHLGVGGLFGWGISGGQDGLVRTGWILGGGLYGGVGFSYKLIEF